VAEDQDGLRIIQAAGAAEIDQARALMAEYSASLSVGSPERRAAEIAALPGEYAPPGGRLLLAVLAGQVAGGVALRGLGAGSCELKRLYVRPGFRGRGLGQALAAAAIGEARAIGYERVRLDTSPFMVEARALYGELGFREIPPYRETDLPGCLFMELELGPSRRVRPSGGARDTPRGT
jgi:putative acetyltransferase